MLCDNPLLPLRLRLLFFTMIDHNPAHLLDGEAGERLRVAGAPCFRLCECLRQHLLHDLRGICQARSAAFVARSAAFVPSEPGLSRYCRHASMAVLLHLHLR